MWHMGLLYLFQVLSLLFMTSWCYSHVFAGLIQPTCTRHGVPSLVLSSCIEIFICPGLLANGFYVYILYVWLTFAALSAVLMQTLCSLLYLNILNIITTCNAHSFVHSQDDITSLSCLPSDNIQSLLHPPRDVTGDPSTISTFITL